MDTKILFALGFIKVRIVPIPKNGVLFLTKVDFRYGFYILTLHKKLYLITEDLQENLTELGQTISKGHSCL